jgi:molybdopterin molybdotransferase
MITVEQALAQCFALVDPLPPEEIPLRRARGRVLWENAVSRLTQPPFAASAMDGYALGSAGAVNTRYRVIGEAGAGHAFPNTLAADEAIRIFTGAPLPQGGVSVALQEDVTVNGADILLNVAAKPNDHIRPKGQDFVQGQILAAPRLLRANDLALLASMNIPTVKVHRKPVVALMATGDELVMPGESPAPDQIVASNIFALAAMVEAAGGIARILPIARDTEASLRTVFDLGMDADVIVTIGGASVGDHDLVGKVAMDLGLERAFWKIAMRPGKPLMAGRLNTSLMLGLPGNPVSAIICGHLFLLPMLAALQGLPKTAPATQTAILTEDMPQNGPRTHYMRARLGFDAGYRTICAFDRQDSALLSILSEADALLIRPLGDGPRRKGDVVDYIAI